MTTPAKSSCTACEKFGLKPFTRENILYYYVPINSLLGYTALSVNVMNPALIARFVPNKDITNFLLIHTLFGTTLYIYSRPHLKSITNGKRIAYSLLGSLLFGMGSVLMWAIARSSIPKNNALATTIGIGSGAIIVKLGRDYFEDCDKAITKN